MKTAHEQRIACTAHLVFALSLFLLFTALALNPGCAVHPDRAPVAPAASDTATAFTNSIGMSLSPVPAGEFIMGSPPDEEGHDPDETQHKVRIARPFFLGVYPVTQSQYLAVMGTNPSYFRGEDDLPVDSVSWLDAVEFCKRLSNKEGRTYRLPTEAEYEYACRAGTTGPYGGDGNIDHISWYWANSEDVTHPVGQLQPNAWGFYDMQGDLWEWCSDWYGPYETGNATNPTGPATGVARILRGGTIEYDKEACRSAFRNYYPPDTQLYYIGFRVVMEGK